MTSSHSVAVISGIGVSLKIPTLLTTMSTWPKLPEPVKAASMTPTTALRCVELWQEAGLPDGVVNVVTCSRNEADLFLKHPNVQGITFVGFTSVGLRIYAKDSQRNPFETGVER